MPITIEFSADLPSLPISLWFASFLVVLRTIRGLTAAARHQFICRVNISGGIPDVPKQAENILRPGVSLLIDDHRFASFLSKTRPVRVLKLIPVPSERHACHLAVSEERLEA